MDSMTDRPEITDAVRNLLAMTDEVVPAKYIAPIVRMSESVIIKYAKEGTWDQEHLGKYVISGNRVKFFRKDFLVKCGFLDPDPEVKTAEQLLTEMLAEVRAMREEMKRIRQCCNTDGTRKDWSYE